MKSHTDSQSVVYNEDGSWTTTTQITEFPASRNEKIAAGLVLGGSILVCVAPMIVLTYNEWQDGRRARKAAKKSEQDD